MHINTGDTAWILASTALVLLMTPGLALFYGGMVRAKNVLGMLMQNFAAIGVVSLVWVWLTYSLAFGPDNGGLIGNFNFFGLSNTDNASGTIPTLVFVAFQLMFAVITPALITGSSADRLKFGSFIIFIIAWSVLVYAPVAHWVWAAGGWIHDRGAEDFAGGTVVHINAGVAGLAVAMVVGKRQGWPKRPMVPHNVPMTLLGAGLLWFGWFGFNAGSALGANNLAANAFINTNTATAAALLAWILVEKLTNGKCTTLGAASGAVAGLVAITPACGFVNILGSTVIGVAAGALCALAVRLKYRLKLDDALDVGGVHFVGGVVGALLIGFFGTAAVGGVDGVFYHGGWALLGRQGLAVVAVTAYSFIMSWLIAMAIHKTIGFRVTPEQEELGMDLALHAETAYELSPSFTASAGHSGAHGDNGTAEPEPVAVPVGTATAGTGPVAAVITATADGGAA
ncbi:MAG TPA: ammonium transporter [Acidimicrobiales bacterium]|nr:ammonium transporter [Acidimicrobiales bacterium]